jgi:hypothetical protein
MGRRKRIRGWCDELSRTGNGALVNTLVSDRHAQQGPMASALIVRLANVGRFPKNRKTGGPWNASNFEAKVRANALKERLNTGLGKS